MSTLFDTYYDCLGHELTCGSTVGFKKGNHFIYGTVTDIVMDTKMDYKFIVIPNIGWSGPDEPKLQNKYKVNHTRIFQIICHRKSNNV